MLALATAPPLQRQGPRRVPRWRPLPQPIRRLPALLLLLLACKGVVGQCPASSVAVTLGVRTTPVAVPALLEGRSHSADCSWVNGGYDGDVEFDCAGSRLTASTSRCVPRGCSAELQVDVLVGDAVKQVSPSSPLLHGETSSASCGNASTGLVGHVWLHCDFGVLQTDGSTCRPRPAGERTFWRLVHEDFVPGTWRIFEVAFYTNEECNGKLDGFQATSSEDDPVESAKRFAFDGSDNTAWAARCEGGCLPGVAWIGVVLSSPSPIVRCVELYQSRVTCCRSRNVRLEVWNGAGWQLMGSWDTSTIVPFAGNTQRLITPRTCTLDFPSGIGVVHDCVGRPVAGVQEGDVCYASCTEGFFGPRQPFRCGHDYAMHGETPECLHFAALYNGIVISCSAVVTIAVAWIYRFWFIGRIHKVRLVDDPAYILPVMKGRWHEKDGMGLWKSALEAEKECAKGKAEEEFPEEIALEDVRSPRSMRRTGKGGGKGGKGGKGGAVGKATSPLNRSPRGGSEGSKADSRRKKEKRKGALRKACLKDLQMNYVAEVGLQLESVEEAEFLKTANTVHVIRESKGHSGDGRIFLDGLCSPCEDPDVCWTVICCTLCRIADTWHTLGTMPWATYWRVLLAYVLLPCLWPCLNMYGRHQIRLFFGIELQPHRDCCIHGCCCCCCTPCALCQEARVVDAPWELWRTRQRLRDKQDGFQV